jgi:hypothetical protein
MSDSAPIPDAGAAGWRLGLLVVMAWVLALNLAPFEFSLGLDGILSRLRGAFRIQENDGIASSILHFPTFAVIGFLVVRAHATRLASLKWSRLVALAVLGCALVEGLKLLAPERHAQVWDLGVKALGVLTGMAWARSRRGRAIWPDGRPVRWLAGGAALGGILCWTWVGLQPVMGALRLDWNPGFRLVMKNEGDGSRPWSGELSEVRIAAGAWRSEDIRKWPPHSPGDEGLVYQIPGNDESPVYPAGLLAGEPGMALEKSACFHATRSPATALARTIMDAGAFTIAARVQTADLHQGGPARIVTFSETSDARNFTLGQQGLDLVFRVANRLNGPNGTRFILQQQALDSGNHALVASYDHGFMAMHVDGRRLPVTLDLREPYYHLPINPSLPGRLAVLVLWVLTVMVPVCFFLWEKAERMRTRAWIVISCLALGVLPFMICCLVGGPFNPVLPISLWVVAGCVWPLAMRYLRRPLPAAP